MVVLNEFLINMDKLPISQEIAKIASDIKYDLDRKGGEKMIFDIIIAVSASPVETNNT